MHTRTLIRPMVALAAVSMVLGLAACSDDDDDDDAATVDSPVVTDPTSSTTAPADGYQDDGGTSDDAGKQGEAAQVEAKDFRFTVLAPSVPAGSDVYFSNTGEKPHTFTADDGSFDSGRVEPGKQAEVKAPAAAGSYTFHCNIHPTMTATLTVLDS